uniref:Uncharacterized protein n=1 Tax=Anopheles gambiae TaxID=7165 RepID=A0A1S4GAQ6_ANOGA
MHATTGHSVHNPNVLCGPLPYTVVARHLAFVIVFTHLQCTGLLVSMVWKSVAITPLRRESPMMLLLSAVDASAYCALIFYF